MSPVSRRIFLYWMLLLVPTLVVGGGAILLLQRERARIDEQGNYANEARRAAIAARLRLTVENAELLIGDVQAGLLDALAAEPAETLDAFLDRWERTNPLVRTAFRVAGDGRLIRPKPGAADEEAREFVRQFERLFQQGALWSHRPEPSPSPSLSPAPSLGAASAARAALKPYVYREADEPAERKEVASNIAQVQSARRDVQELFKARDQALAEPVVKPTEEEERTALADSYEAPSRRRDAGAQSAGQTRGAPAAASSRAAAAPRAQAGGLSAKVALAKTEAAGRRGWWPTTIDGRLHLLAWVESGGDGEVRGVEVETAALIARLRSALPAVANAGEGFALRDASGRIVHRSGAVPANATPTERVAISSALLPGWDAAGYFTASARASSSAGFVGLGLLLVGILVAAILAGGSLLLWQARRSEAEAVQKTSFVANVSHEFKTPLTTIRLYSELLEQGRVRDPAQGRDYLRTIGRETQRLARLVNNALDFSRLEQGRRKYARDPVDVGAEVARLLDTQAPRLGEAGLRVERALPVEPLWATTDRDAFEQIVLNLIDNACKYAADGGELTVSVRPRAGGGVDVRVGDRGPGVIAAQRERIFEKFHRVDDTLTAEKTGAGLGLSIARQLARGLGGDVRCDARPGGGAEFVVELP